MGVWLGALGRLDVIPEPDDNLLKEFVEFSKQSYPEEYRRSDEFFSNTWFFDSDNKLISHIGKFAEPSIWHRHLVDNFFKPRGYQLLGDLLIIGEDDPCFHDFAEERNKEYQVWKKRVEALFLFENQYHNY